MATPVCKGYLSKLSRAGANTWKKKYFVLLPDGTLSVSDKRGSAPKQFFYLNPSTTVSMIPDGELKGETGFYVAVNPANSKDIVCVKSSRQEDITRWDSAVKHVLKAINASNKARDRMSVSDIYNKMTGPTSSKRKGRLNGYVMKVGKKPDSGDFFVNGNTFEYFRSEEDCARGKKPVGKASLQLLV